MKIIKHLDHIYEVENFLTDQQIDLFLSEARNQDGWDTTHTGNTIKIFSEPVAAELKNILSNLLSSFTNAQSLLFTNNVRRLAKGEFMSPHVDSGYDGKDNDIVFGVVIYLNNDFEGGELVYPDLGLSLTPKPKSMIVHNSKLKHQVSTVMANERYSITTFVFGDESTKFNMVCEHKYQYNNHTNLIECIHCNQMYPKNYND